jgi:hypothetical protein
MKPGLTIPVAKMQHYSAGENIGLGDSGPAGDPLHLNRLRQSIAPNLNAPYLTLPRMLPSAIGDIPLTYETFR